MTTLTRAVGALLILVGVVAYVGSDTESLTALLPSLLGAILLVLGLLAGREAIHRHAIHGALVIALLGFIGTLPRALPLLTGGDVDLPAAAWASLATAVLCLVYLGFGVRSFVAARRARARADA